MYSVHSVQNVIIIRRSIEFIVGMRLLVLVLNRTNCLSQVLIVRDKAI